MNQTQIKYFFMCSICVLEFRNEMKCKWRVCLGLGLDLTCSQVLPWQRPLNSVGTCLAWSLYKGQEVIPYSLDIQDFIEWAQFATCSCTHVVPPLAYCVGRKPYTNIWGTLKCLILRCESKFHFQAISRYGPFLQAHINNFLWMFSQSHYINFFYLVCNELLY